MQVQLGLELLDLSCPTTAASLVYKGVVLIL